MSARELIGFSYNDIDRLAYNHSDSHPDELGLKVLRELHGVDDWDAARDRLHSSWENDMGAATWHIVALIAHATHAGTCSYGASLEAEIKKANSQ